jgi:hypothetical protein
VVVVTCPTDAKMKDLGHWAADPFWKAEFRILRTRIPGDVPELRRVNLDRKGNEVYAGEVDLEKTHSFLDSQVRDPKRY